MINILQYRSICFTAKIKTKHTKALFYTNLFYTF